VKVLVIDDSRTMRKMIRSALEGINGSPAEVVEASDGIEALGLLQGAAAGFDLLLLDWNMPRLDGLGFLKQLKALSPAMGIPVIMVTSQSQRGLVAEALRWGARDFVVKPFSAEVLREKVRKVLSQREPPRSEETSVMLKSIAAAPRPPQAEAFLDCLPPDLADEVRRRALRQEAAAGAVLLRPDQRVDALYLIAEGEVEVVPEEDPAGAEVRGQGDCFAELAFLSQDVARVTVRARTPVEFLALARAQVRDLIQQKPQLGYHISGLVARRPRETVSAVPAVGAAALAGRLETLPVPDLIQILNICRKTGHLKLDRDGRSAGIFFEEGEIRHAWVGAESGEKAFCRILEWMQASFTFESGARAPQVTVAQPTMTLLMEGMRQLDERRKAGGPGGMKP
jgi:two-component system chemotaxis response regulator CheY